jgi:hypothetical protein
MRKKKKEKVFKEILYTGKTIAGKQVKNARFIKPLKNSAIFEDARGGRHLVSLKKLNMKGNKDCYECVFNPTTQQEQYHNMAGGEV